jgi:DNA helicase II / ATP-dependent DNA helicase PcrA
VTDFKTKYTRLNTAQKQAVDTIEGPVMVIAGPGTGKTELLSMRVANILKQTDSLPQNILCLTFTESGASAMRERLVSLIGKDAYPVAIHTFHSFGSEIINTYREFFYQGAQFHAAHELTTHEILARILKKLPHDSLLATQMNGEFTQLSNIQHSISDFKKAGLTPDDLQTLVAHNTSFLNFAEAHVTDFFKGTVNKTMLSALPDLHETLRTYQPETFPFVTLPELSSVFLRELERVLDDNSSTKPLTAWRNKWFEKNAEGNFVFKDRKRHKKLLEASHVYWNYLSAMQEASVYDYDDMILKTTLALELFPELRNQLQEKYQYILVDEFQDTNLAQLKIILSLIDNPIHEEKPNILIVGDDDQAIYSFQGAEVSNIMTLQHRFRDPAIIPLVDNYRSDSQILKHARDVITQGTDRLETALVNLDKTPVPHAAHTDASVGLHEATSSEEEYAWIAHDIHRTCTQSPRYPGAHAISCAQKHYL